ncbi:hypothetical protein NA57DRAFT_52260 [Rhizodiscina lignyota]|uniref:Uncharacterized protein n=1 Tax=Rhizodiscina lignyota TaxID=1504668 RepID=A0A9P4M9E1_9PEZI|nr:hypothetical protein NA57DRAFT_52260 [Rhizodiscina lignyota]
MAGVERSTRTSGSVDIQGVSRDRSRDCRGFPAAMDGRANQPCGRRAAKRRAKRETAGGRASGNGRRIAGDPTDEEVASRPRKKGKEGLGVREDVRARSENTQRSRVWWMRCKPAAASRQISARAFTASPTARPAGMGRVGRAQQWESDALLTVTPQRKGEHWE